MFSLCKFKRIGKSKHGDRRDASNEMAIRLLGAAPATYYFLRKFSFKWKSSGRQTFLFLFYLFYICSFFVFRLVVWVVRSFGRSVVRDSAEQRNNNKYEKVRRNETIEGKEKKNTCSEMELGGVVYHTVIIYIYIYFGFAFRFS